MASTGKSSAKVKCDDCGCYLSFPPVFVKCCGQSICGQCNEGKEHLTFRNKAYEALAESQIFPCRFKSLGCQEEHPWEEIQHHEEQCIYQKYKCFIKDCAWNGIQFNLKQHFEAEHPNNVLNLPCDVKPNITVSKDTLYLTSALNNLFIVQIKYSLSTSVLSYYVSFLGLSKFAENFEYVVEISSIQGNLSITKIVQPINNLNFPQKANTIELNLNNLLATVLVSKYNDCKLNVFIKLKNNICADCKIELSAQNIHGFNCNDCYKKSKQQIIVFNVFDDACKSCENCDYKNIPDYLHKHKAWFCLESYCLPCKEKVPRFSHYIDKHVPKNWVFHSNHVEFKDIFVGDDKEAVFKTNDAIFLIKFCITYRDKIIFSVLSNLPKNDLKYYECSYTLLIPEMNILQNETVPIDYKSSDHDWDVYCNILGMKSKNYQILYNIEIRISENI